MAKIAVINVPGVGTHTVSVFNKYQLGGVLPKDDGSVDILMIDPDNSTAPSQTCDIYVVPVGDSLPSGAVVGSNTGGIGASFVELSTGERVFVGVRIS